MCLAWSVHAAIPAGQDSSTLKDVKELDSRKFASDPETWPGAAVFRQTCSHCHQGQVPKAPQKMFLQMMAPASILAALNSGLMKEQGAALSPQARRDVAEYLGGEKLDANRNAPQAPRCAAPAASASAGAGGSAGGGASASRSPVGADPTQLPVALGWGFDNARFTPADVAKLSRDEVPRLQLKWAFEYPGAIRARSQPSIAFGNIYTGSQDGTVYALDLHTGCVRWVSRTSAEVRTAMVISKSTLYFGDVIARVHAMDAKTGKELWNVKIDDHPNATITGSPTFHDGVLYVPVSSLEVTSAADAQYECCKFRGAVVAINASTGTVIWKAHTITEEPAPVRTTSSGTRVFAPSGAPVWNAPTVDARRGVLYVGSGENYSSPANDRSDAVLAFNLKDGHLVWSHQMLAGDAWNVACMMKGNANCPGENGPDVDVAAGTILTTLPNGKQVLLAGQKNGFVYAIDPDAQGKLLWQRRVGRGGIQGGVHFGMALEGQRLFVPISDLKDGHDGRRYDIAGKPGLYALDPADGRLLWSTPAQDVCNERRFCDPGISAAITATPGVVFAGHMDGVLRAYDAATGQVIWKYDATAGVKTVSGTTAHGGSFGGPGPVVRDGYVVVNSGYGLYFHMPGNVLLVFAAPGR
ncbi:MAG: PQQ-binding-like beta-propeller repeat protein [Proteobacteria bacterium]|nr:PQQ-binding-like beta-propeller repeat protein [Pseudomonadota bacterium]